MTNPAPANINRYIKLVSTDALDKDCVRQWVECAKSELPPGVLGTIQMTDDNGNLRSVSLVHREYGDRHEYILPLTREVLDTEVEPLVQCFCSACPEVDYDIETSAPRIGMLTDPRNVEVDDTKFQELCTAWAKQQHESWLKDRQDNGWTYGTTVSLKNKTHPLLRPWHDLPDEFRKVDTSQPQSLLDLLNDQGYAVIGRGELEGILRLIKGMK
jgi:hypothetical protein